eukprot:4316900-Amphidinium_carterae.1
MLFLLDLHSSDLLTKDLWFGNPTQPDGKVSGIAFKGYKAQETDLRNPLGQTQHPSHEQQNPEVEVR